MSQAFAYESPRFAPAPALRSLRRRFKGALVEPGGNGWGAATQAFNLTVTQEPAIAALPQDVEDVVALVEFARANGLQLTAQRTGHNAEPLGSLDETILVKTDAMQGVEIDVERKIARVAAGVKWEGRPEGLRSRARRAARLHAGRQRRRLLARRRRRLVCPKARAVHQQRHGDRARHRRRPAPPRRPRQRAGPVLGAARRRRQLRHRHRARGAALLDPGDLRRRPLLPLGAFGRGAARVARVDGRHARGDDLGGPDPAVPAHPGDPRAAPRREVRDRRGHLHGR